MGIKGGCNDPECCASSDIMEDLTFGKGELSDLGYWEFPCEPCEKAWIANGKGVCKECGIQYSHDAKCSKA